MPQAANICSYTDFRFTIYKFIPAEIHVYDEDQKQLVEVGNDLVFRFWYIIGSPNVTGNFEADFFNYTSPSIQINQSAFEIISFNPTAPQTDGKGHSERQEGELAIRVTQFPIDDDDYHNPKTGSDVLYISCRIRFWQPDATDN